MPPPPVAATAQPPNSVAMFPQSLRSEMTARGLPLVGRTLTSTVPTIGVVNLSTTSGDPLPPQDAAVSSRAPVVSAVPVAKPFANTSSLAPAHVSYVAASGGASTGPSTTPGASTFDSSPLQPTNSNETKATCARMDIRGPPDGTSMVSQNPGPSAVSYGKQGLTRADPHVCIARENRPWHAGQLVAAFAVSRILAGRSRSPDRRGSSKRPRRSRGTGAATRGLGYAAPERPWL